MKMLTVFPLVCAMMALANAAVVPEAEPVEVIGQLSIQQEAEPVEKTEEAPAQHDDGLSVLGSGRCPYGWTSNKDRCYIYISSPMTWARAEKDCMTRGGHLASVRDFMDYHVIQGVILTQANGYTVAWLGGSDAQQDGVWLWSDGSNFVFSNWCSGSHSSSSYGCLVMNYGVGKCSAQQSCTSSHPFVCAMTV